MGGERPGAVSRRGAGVKAYCPDASGCAGRAVCRHLSLGLPSQWCGGVPWASCRLYVGLSACSCSGAVSEEVVPVRKADVTVESEREWTEE